MSTVNYYPNAVTEIVEGGGQLSTMCSCGGKSDTIYNLLDRAYSNREPKPGDWVQYKTVEGGGAIHTWTPIEGSGGYMPTKPVSSRFKSLVSRVQTDMLRKRGI